MKQVLYNAGQAVVEDVPPPLVQPGCVLVRVDHSCISVGTEISGLRASGDPLWKRALKNPQLVKRAAQYLAAHGLRSTREMLRQRAAQVSATGYSAAGVVIEVGEGVTEFRAGDRVACTGAQCAHHAEIICVPVNLAAPVPADVALSEASSVALGAIALQGVRRAAPTLGETFVVLGLGILGQLTAQILRANGCRVIGTDLDAGRLELAGSLGMDLAVAADGDLDVEQVLRLTDGVGADGVIVTAATPSHAVISTAFSMCRRKGRVVLVGDVGLNLQRADIYQKELDFFVSTSYGPGRYDRGYEEGGLDYPIGYVRWTENRNMAEYLRLLARGQVRLQPLITATYPITRGAKAYQRLKSAEGGERPMMVLLSYPAEQATAAANASRVVVVNAPAAGKTSDGRVGVAVVGAGSFAKAMHLPNLRALDRLYRIEAIVSGKGHNAKATAEQFAARYATTDFDAALNDDNVDAVLIATRHHVHATMVLKALEAGKHVLVEKPLALEAEELEAIAAFYEGHAQPPLLLTGFNRRFSPHAARLRDLTQDRTGPLVINYRMNAGYIPLDAWYHGPEGGGRNRGEACHIYDLFVYLTGSRAVEVAAHTARPRGGYYSAADNFTATATFADGSLATLTYTALGCSSYPKESMEIYCDGTVLELNDYRETIVHGGMARRGAGLTTKLAEKGHREELVAFARAVREGGEWPIPLWQQVEATRISFDVERQMHGEMEGPIAAESAPQLQRRAS